MGLAQLGAASQTTAGRVSKSPPTPAIATRPASPIWPGAAFPRTPGGARHCGKHAGRFATLIARVPQGRHGDQAQSAGRRHRWRKQIVEPVFGQMPEASGSSCCGASTKSEANGR